MTNFEKEYQAFCDTHGVPDRIELMLCDINAVLRGKWLPGDQVRKFAQGAVRLPLSTYVANIQGSEVEETGTGITVGDPDGKIVPVPGSLKPVPWLAGNVAQVLVELQDDTAKSPLSPREVLRSVLDRFGDAGLSPVVATELEFYVVQKRANSDDAPHPPARLPDAQNYDLEVLARHENMLTDIQSASRTQGLAVDTLIAEYGPGQFEINFHHTSDILCAADTALLFRRLVRGVADNHGLEATFMAKPYATEPGNGMHVHASVLDKNGDNIFSADQGISPRLGAAVAGVVTTMRELQAVFAPHLNSYRRYLPNSFAPSSPNWGMDNRGAAVRLPETKGPGARLEHRISGADVNPYLALAAVLGGMFHGLTDQPDLPLPMEDPDAVEPARLNHDWRGAVDLFASSEIASDIFGAAYRDIYAAVRRDEIAALTSFVTPVEYRYYLSRL